MSIFMSVLIGENKTAFVPFIKIKENTEVELFDAFLSNTFY